MTKEILIKSALRALVNGEMKQGSAGYALEEDSAYEVSWKDVLKWLEQQPSECTEHPCLDKLCRYYKQPYKDCISREALLNSIEEPMNWTDSESEIQEQKDYENFVAIVKSMPIVTPQPTRWIPCNERMPEKTDFYLIQYSRKICHDEMAVAFYSVEEAECDKNYTWEFKPFADCKEVIAWMPLPKPYKEDEENES